MSDAKDKAYDGALVRKSFDNQPRVRSTLFGIESRGFRVSGAKNRVSGKKQDKKELRVEGQRWQLGGRHQSETAWLTCT